MSPKKKKTKKTGITGAPHLRFIRTEKHVQRVIHLRTHKRTQKTASLDKKTVPLVCLEPYDIQDKNDTSNLYSNIAYVEAGTGKKLPLVLAKESDCFTAAVTFLRLNPSFQSITDPPTLKAVMMEHLKLADADIMLKVLLKDLGTIIRTAQAITKAAPSDSNVPGAAPDPSAAPGAAPDPVPSDSKLSPDAASSDSNKQNSIDIANLAVVASSQQKDLGGLKELVAGGIDLGMAAIQLGKQNQEGIQKNKEAITAVDKDLGGLKEVAANGIELGMTAIKLGKQNQEAISAVDKESKEAVAAVDQRLDTHILESAQKEAESARAAKKTQSILDQFSADLEELKNRHPFGSGGSAGAGFPLGSGGDSAGGGLLSSFGSGGRGPLGSGGGSAGGGLLSSFGSGGRLSSLLSGSNNRKLPPKTSPIPEHAQAVVSSKFRSNYKEDVDTDDADDDDADDADDDFDGLNEFLDASMGPDCAFGAIEGPLSPEQRKFAPHVGDAVLGMPPQSPSSLRSLPHHGTTPSSILKTPKGARNSLNNQSSSRVKFTPLVRIQEYNHALAPNDGNLNGWPTVLASPRGSPYDAPMRNNKRTQTYESPQPRTSPEAEAILLASGYTEAAIQQGLDQLDEMEQREQEALMAAESDSPSPDAKRPASDLADPEDSENEPSPEPKKKKSRPSIGPLTASRAAESDY